MSGPGQLFVVSTPIGNMGDFSFRAVEILRSVAVILAEDTRHSRPLLDRYEIRVPMLAYHEHNEARATPAILTRLSGGEDIAMISDAGTPVLSDPGYRLTRAAIAEGIRVVPVPGASAVLAALVASGLPAERFTFFGFLPRAGRERSAALADIAELGHTAILFEAPSRVGATLAALAAAGCAGSAACVARELTKQFEEIRRGTVAELAAAYADEPPRGEVVIVLGPRERAPIDEDALRERAVALRAAGETPRAITRLLMEEHGASRNLAYRLAHDR